jgi:hypothetical protein
MEAVVLHPSPCSTRECVLHSDEEDDDEEEDADAADVSWRKRNRSFRAPLRVDILEMSFSMAASTLLDSCASSNAL